jgi:predicted ATP-dependent endonuclease of OLD family
LVEGPSDAIIFERAYRDIVGSLPIENGVDVISMGGLTSRRALEVCRALKRRVTALQDNDGRTPDEIVDALGELLEDETRVLFVGDPDDGTTLEPQLVSANSINTLRAVLGLKDSVDPLEWMTNNKTEMAIRIFDAKEPISMPRYVREAIEFLRQHT